MTQSEFVPGGTVTTPKGFSAGATYAGIKKPGENVLDLGIIYSQEPCDVAGVFTTNKIKSAAVVVNQQNLAKKGKVSAIIVNSGCANSSTGEQGIADAIETAELVANALGTEPEEVLVASTGVIGVPLPMDAIRKGIHRVLLTADGGHDFARSIMTTDTVPKEVAVTEKHSGITFTIGGVAKGSGMVHPNLATMLAFLTTDAAVAPDFLESALRKSVDISFNMISVDGDTSPSDTVLLLANGTVQNQPIGGKSPFATVFQEALDKVCIYLAKAIARDGEGATKLIEITVRNALTVDEARRAARTIASSNLVKAAIYGRDPNWGRVTAALGRSNIEVVEPKLEVIMAGIPVLKNGRPLSFDRQTAVKALGGKEVPILVDLHLGTAEATAWGCDLTEQYVKINAEYTT
ncbi:MAG: bifunctional glutamate N-acetyltransferase/amino-acid acetyltransferase ArgJ [Dehalococcoidia bacterium]|nr:bifunctional glutamate N-acetyltransferase/amino-acid acetyltransferase ArgJ [Dehalococcoidia bacterium]